jgi:hypothetical protein
MEGIALLVPGAVLSVAYLLQPLVTDDIDAPWDRFELLDSESEDSTQPDNATRQRTAATGPDGRRALTDGGRVCHSCGAYVDGDYTYCGECLTPRV